MAPPSEHAQAVLSRFDGTVAVDLEVAGTSWVLPSLRELRLVGDLAGFDPLPGQDLMVPVRTDAGRPRWRRYTVRAIDRASGELALWVTTDTTGPGARWALEARLGDRIEAVGPRGKVRLDARAEHHVFVVDASGLSTLVAMGAALRGTSTARGFALLDPAQLFEVEQRRAPGLDSIADHAEVSYRADERALLAAVRDELGAELAARGGDHGVAAYVLCELALSRGALGALVSLGVRAESVTAKPYWRAGEPNQDHGEPDKADPSLR